MPRSWLAWCYHRSVRRLGGGLLHVACGVSRILLPAVRVWGGGGGGGGGGNLVGGSLLGGGGVVFIAVYL